MTADPALVGSAPPGPITRVLDWVATLPLGGWWAFAVLAAIEFAWGQTVLWAGGRLEPGQLDRTIAILLVYGPYTLAAVAVGRRVARRSLATFWPATGWPEADRALWGARFATAPARWEWVGLIAGLIAGLAALLAAPGSALGPESGRALVLLAYAPEYLLGYGLSGGAAVIGLHWLVLVARIHRQAEAIDPFDRAPIYAFSRLTVVSGLTYILAVYYTFTVNGSLQAGNVPSILFIAGSVVLGVVEFVAPLWGIHDRLVDAKAALARDVEQRMNRLAAELYGRIDAGAFESTKVITDALSGMLALRDRVAHLPTWPWSPQLFRGFVSALLLPVIVYLLTRLAGSILGA